MKSYRQLVLKYIKGEKKSIIPICLAIILTITMLTSVVFIGQNTVLNAYEKIKLRYGDYDTRIENLDKEKLEKLKANPNVKDLAVGKQMELLLYKISYYGQEWISSINPYAVEPKVLNEYMSLNMLKGDLPKNKGEIIASKNIIATFGENIDIGSVIKFEEIQIPGEDNVTEKYYQMYDELMKDIDLSNDSANIDLIEFDKSVREELKKKYGNLIVTNREYTLVGIIDADAQDPIWGQQIITLLTEDQLNNLEGNNIHSFTYLEDFNKQEELAEELGLKYIKPIGDMKKYGVYASDFKYPGYDKEEYTSVLRNPLARNIILVSIIFCFMAIFNTFHASVAKRLKYYGILRAIGGSMKQITYLIFVEALLLYIISIPMGLLLGFLLVKLEGFIVSDKLNLISNFRSDINMEVIIITLIATLLIVLYSVYSALKREGKLTPIQAITDAKGLGDRKTKIKNVFGQNINTDRNGEIDTEATKEILEFEKTTFIYKTMKKLFKFEGELAGKNIRRDAGVHKLTKLTLIISMSALIFFFLQVVNGRIEVNLINNNLNWDTQILSGEERVDSSKLEEIKNIKGVDDAYYLSYKDVSIVLKEENISTELMSIIKNLDYKKVDEDTKTLAIRARITTLDDEALKLYNGLDKEALDNGGVAVVNKGTSYYYSSTGQGVLIPIWGRSNPVLNYGVNDTLKISSDLNLLNSDGLKEFYKSNEKLQDIKIVSTVDDDVFNSIYKSTNPNEVDRDVTLLTTEEGLMKLIGNYDKSEFLLKVTDSSERKASIKELTGFIAKNNYELVDKVGIKADLIINIRENLGFNIIFAITMIIMVVLNLINTMSASIMAREKELAGMRAIGMSASKQTKMIIAEVFNLTLIAAFTTILIIGGITLSTQGENASMGRVNMLNLFFGYLIIISIVMIVANITTIVPLQNLKKIIIVDSLKSE